MLICIYICIYVCICVCIYIYIYIHRKTYICMYFVCMWRERDRECVIIEAAFEDVLKKR